MVNDFWRDREALRMQHRSVFITGCTGLLGSWMVAELVKRGAKVTGLVRDLVPQSRLYTDDWADKINIVRGCVEDLAAMERAIALFPARAVFFVGAIGCLSSLLLLGAWF